MVIALQLAGSIAAQSTALAQIFGAGVTPDPMPAIGNILMLAGITLAVASGLHVKAAIAMARSYEILPMGLPVPAADVAAWGTARVAQAFALGFSLAAPFVIAGFAYNLALGAINRAMPQLMVAFIGAPAITAGGLLILMLAAPVILHFWERGSTRRSPIRWRCRDERGRGGSGEKVFDPTPQQAGRGAAQGRHPALRRRHRGGDLPRAPRGRRHRRRLRASPQAASVLMVFIAQPDRLTGRILGPGGPRPLRLRSSARRCARWRRSSWCRSRAVLVSLFAQQAITFSGEKLEPKLSRLSLLANAKQQVRRRPGSSSSPRRRSSSPPSPSRSSSISRATSTG